MNIVTAQHLDNWSASLAARAELPEIVASLIRSSCRSLESYRFPSRDASQMHGFDGVAEVSEAHAFVPAGTSIWEFGTGKDFRTKADADYGNRTKDFTAVERACRTFVFVTSRKWDGGLDGWERAHSGDGWLKVRALDAVSLERWLDEFPSVAIPLARKLGIIPPSGVRTLDDFWDEYRLRFNRPATAEILLNGRAERAKRLLDELAAGLPNLRKWQADSPEEAGAFVAAAVMGAERETSAYLRAKTLIIDTVDAARTVPTTNSFIFILPPPVARMGPALAITSQVVLTLGSDDPATDSERLEPMNIVDFAAGLKSMGIQEDEAFRLARICGRSPTVLSRLIPSGTYELPRWRDDGQLLPIALAGGWDASNKHDRLVIAALCAVPYEQVDAAARRLASVSDAPLDLEGSIWTLRSPKDAFTLIGRLVDTGLQHRYQEACRTVFSERDRTLDAGEAGRQAIPFRGDDFLHSEWLRRGLARTLLLISGLHQAARFHVISGTPEEYVDRVVGAIPGLAGDIRTLVSLKAEFPRLCEAAPRPLARALERVLEGDGETWKTVVFRDKKDGTLWGSSPHTYLLWGLETLAWSPEYLLRAASILMTLAAFDPGGRLANRPLSSLREIFLAWRPNTYASIDDRIAVLRSICAERPEQGLKLLMSLLPKNHDFSGGTVKPHLRDFGQSRSKPTTVADVRYAYQHYASIAVDLAGMDVARLATLVEALPQLGPADRGRALAAMRTSAMHANAEDSYRLWSKLRQLAQRHRNFPEAAWSMKEDQLAPIEDVCRVVQPRDLVLRVVWLFDDYSPKAGMPRGGDGLVEANRERAEVIREILRDGGLPGVLRLASLAKLPHFVAIALVDADSGTEVLQEALEAAVTADSKINPDFAIALSSAARERLGFEWERWVGTFARNMAPRPAATLFLRWRDTRDTWDFVGSLSADIEREYWLQKWAFRPSSAEELDFAFNKYAGIGRYSAILDMVGYREAVLSTPRCIQTLRGLADELQRDLGKMQQVHYELVHMIQDLQQRNDVDLIDLAALEYQYLPILEFQAETVALNRVLGSSPEFFIGVLSDAFLPASGEREEITDEQRLRGGLAYRILQSIKTVPGFSSGGRDLNHLRWWISEVRALARESDRAAIADQQIGQILAFAPLDADDEAWPCRPVRDLLEELHAPEIEKGIAISRFNQGGAFTKAMYSGGDQERGIAQQYRNWAGTARAWVHTSALLRRIADDWDRHAGLADHEAQLDQLRDS